MLFKKSTHFKNIFWGIRRHSEPNHWHTLRMRHQIMRWAPRHSPRRSSSSMPYRSKRKRQKKSEVARYLHSSLSKMNPSFSRRKNIRFTSNHSSRNVPIWRLSIIPITKNSGKSVEKESPFQRVNMRRRPSFVSTAVSTSISGKNCRRNIWAASVMSPPSSDYSPMALGYRHISPSTSVTSIYGSSGGNQGDGIWRSWEVVPSDRSMLSGVKSSTRSSGIQANNPATMTLRTRCREFFFYPFSW